jgi:retinol-binding protein 3
MLKTMLALLATLPLVALQAGAATSALSEKEKSEVIEGLALQLRSLYVESGADRKTLEGAIRAKAKRGGYRVLSTGPEFARELEVDLRMIGRDPHFRVDWYPDQVPPLPTSFIVTKESLDRQRAPAATGRKNGFPSVARLDGNVGYLEINDIFDADLIKETAAAAMTFVTHTDALIVDLRRARGGEPNGVAHVLSYFLTERTHAFDMVSLNERTHFVTDGWLPGPRYDASKPVFVLTSKDTFSGGESLAYCLQAFKRARVVGEKTTGGSTAAMPVKLSAHFSAGIPALATIVIATGGNWNNVGVIPDVEAPGEKARDVAYRLALEHILTIDSNPARQERIRALLQQIKP